MATVELATLELREYPRSEAGEEDAEYDDPEWCEQDWMERKHREIFVGGRKVGILKVMIFDREVMRDMYEDGFHGLMDEPSQEVCDFAITLFDDDGYFREKISGPQTGGEHGTGVFGSELNIGPLFYLEEIAVEKIERSKGIGAAAIHAFLKEHAAASILYAWPAVLQEGQQTEQFDAKLANIHKFFQKVGFRRIGRTEYLAYSVDPKHPSRKLATDEDAHGRAPGPSSEEAAAAFPLHIAVGSLNGDALLAIIASAPLAQVKSIEPSGWTPLHIAAAAAKGDATRALVHRSNAELLATDEVGRTPAALMEHSIQGKKEFMRAMGMDISDYPHMVAEQERDAELLAWLKTATLQAHNV
ncbi:hypothetical protein FIBSPDRAFT_849829 [Athelia psychrophila]|uniref:Uncharacterized protein n=1 Tax=Athelia psychrophila TaxID=1759441 RepID=A0A166U5F5_9AGAM|nr:hypothetical protein FIBSPDRAFT_849829 [Fibularhizoctonia sp. CBS 109695]